MNDSEKTNRARVLLLGDSIRQSYQPLVVQRLKARAEVVGPEENGQFSEYTLQSLDRWLAELGKPDVVHWNNGIHDVGHNPGRTPAQIPLDAYLANLRSILGKLRETKARIIWATTTPVHPNRPFVSNEWSWRKEEVDKYNDAAIELMRSEEVPINDLHSLIASNCDDLLGEDMLHLSEHGVNACAASVAAFIRIVLDLPERNTEAPS